MPSDPGCKIFKPAAAKEALLNMSGELQNGRDDDTDFGTILSTRNLLVALISLSLGGSGASVYQSTQSISATHDRYTGSDANEDQAVHRREHQAERALIVTEQLAAGARVTALQQELEKIQERIRNIEIEQARRASR